MTPVRMTMGPGAQAALDQPLPSPRAPRAPRGPRGPRARPCYPPPLASRATLGACRSAGGVCSTSTASIPGPDPRKVCFGPPCSSEAGSHGKRALQTLPRPWRPRRPSTHPRSQTQRRAGASRESRAHEPSDAVLARLRGRRSCWSEHRELNFNWGFNWLQSLDSTVGPVSPACRQQTCGLHRAAPGTLDVTQTAGRNASPGAAVRGVAGDVGFSSLVAACGGGASRRACSRCVPAMSILGLL